jgi:hypothetical protein
VVPVGGWVRIEALLAAILAAVERGSSLSIDGREIALATSPHLGQAAYLRGRAG